jgi:hypothetical protein
MLAGRRLRIVAAVQPMAKRHAGQPEQPGRATDDRNDQRDQRYGRIHFDHVGVGHYASYGGLSGK